MLKYLHKNSLFYAIPEDIDNAEVFSYLNYENNSILLIGEKDTKLLPKDFSEFFVNSNEGIIYFSSIIKSVNKNRVEIDVPKDYEILQRRENKRIKMNSYVVIKKDNKEKTVMLVDLSENGIKISTDEQVSLNSEYEVIFNFEEFCSSFKFIPQRIFVNENEHRYQISGQIESKTPKDKITLVQYCYRKLYELSNRK